MRKLATFAAADGQHREEWRHEKLWSQPKSGWCKPTDAAYTHGSSACSLTRRKCCCRPPAARAALAATASCPPHLRLAPAWATVARLRGSVGRRLATGSAATFVSRLTCPLCALFALLGLSFRGVSSQTCCRPVVSPWGRVAIILPFNLALLPKTSLLRFDPPGWRASVSRRRAVSCSPCRLLWFRWGTYTARIIYIV